MSYGAVNTDCFQYLLLSSIMLLTDLTPPVRECSTFVHLLAAETGEACSLAALRKFLCAD